MPKQNKNWEIIEELINDFASLEYEPENPMEGRRYTYGQIPNLNRNVRQLLKTQKHQLIEELMGIVEGMERRYTVPIKKVNEDMNGRTDSYNQAISEIKQKLKSLKENK